MLNKNNIKFENRIIQDINTYGEEHIVMVVIDCYEEGIQDYYMDMPDLPCSEELKKNNCKVTKFSLGHLYKVRHFKIY